MKNRKLLSRIRIPRFESARRNFSPMLGAMLLALLVSIPSAAQAAKKWMDPAPFDPTANGKMKFEDSSAAIGKRGYAVLVRAQYPKRFTGYSKQSRLHSRVMVRVRPPGAKKFGPVKALGPLGSSAPTVKIGENGFTAVAWLSKSMRTTVTTSLPRGGWSKHWVVNDQPSQSTGVLSVGPDGTSALLTEGRWIAEGVRPPLFASIRVPGMDFGQATRIVSEEYPRGYYTAVVAGRKGKATAVFASACPLDRPLEEVNPMQYVDLKGTDDELQLFGQADIPNSKWPTSYPTLSQDSVGRQYLLINGSAPFKLVMPDACHLIAHAGNWSHRRERYMRST